MLPDKELGRIQEEASHKFGHIPAILGMSLLGCRILSQAANRHPEELTLAPHVLALALAPLQFLGIRDRIPMSKLVEVARHIDEEIEKASVFPQERDPGPYPEPVEHAKEELAKIFGLPEGTEIEIIVGDPSEGGRVMELAVSILAKAAADEVINKAGSK